LKTQFLFYFVGKSCVQLLTPHSSSITSIHFNVATKTVASGSVDGTIVLYTVALSNEINQPKSDPTQLPVVSEYDFSNKFGPKLVIERQLTVVARVDLLSAGALSPIIRSLHLAPDASKVLVASKSGEIFEIACVTSGTPPPDPVDGVVPDIDPGRITSNEIGIILICFHYKMRRRIFKSATI